MNRDRRHKRPDWSRIVPMEGWHHLFPTQTVAINGSIHGLGARSLCEVLAKLNPGDPCSIPLTATRPRQNPRWQKPRVLSCSKGHSVLRRYYFGVELIFRNSASVPIQSGTQFYAGHNSVAKRRHIVPMAHSRGEKP